VEEDSEQYHSHPATKKKKGSETDFPLGGIGSSSWESLSLSSSTVKLLKGMV